MTKLMMKDFKHILFDAYGTIFDAHLGTLNHWQKLGDEVNSAYIS